MKNLTLLLLPLLLLSCGSDEAPPEATTEGDVDAARMFIRAALNGNYKAAQNLIVPDSANQEWLAAAERAYTRTSDVTRQRGLRESSINLHNTTRLNDSTTVVEYSNSFYKDRRDKVKVVRQDGKWLVDLKYTFQPSDSTAK